jgi:hypothetical protein
MRNRMLAMLPLWVACIACATAQTRDTTPPSTPARLEATAQSPSQVLLTWNAANDANGVPLYKVFRNGAEAASASTNAHSDPGLVPGTRYVYRVAGVDPSGNVSALSAEVSVTTPPSNAFAVGDLVRTLRATEVRSAASSTATLLGSAPAGATGTVIAESASANGVAWWRIDYADAALADGWSAEASLERAGLSHAGNVTQIRALHRNGQTFITWHDAEEGQAGEKYRYTVYRSAQPITAANLVSAQRIASDVMHHSGKRIGHAFNLADRRNPAKPMAVLEQGGEQLPLWSGVLAYTAKASASAYYAVVARNTQTGQDLPLVAGSNSLANPVAEQVAALQPIPLWRAADVAPSVAISGEQGLPLMLSLHASAGVGLPAPADADAYLYYGTDAMGWQTGMQGSFGMQEFNAGQGYGFRVLKLQSSDAIVHPSGENAVETLWFGYNAVPQNSTDPLPRAHPYTENRLDWMLQWAVSRYGADPNRIYSEGYSMGGWGTVSYALRRPDRFAAVFPILPRTRQTALLNLAPGQPGYINKSSGANPLMPDGSTPYFDRMDSVAHVASRHDDLPFIGWAIGRQDGFATWGEQVAFVQALKANRHGFAFAWNNGDHSGGLAPIAQIRQYYPANLFARNKSYPAFSNSSIDSNIGDGSPTSGDLEGGINLGFRWSNLVDEPGQWSASVSNDLARAPMTVDITPRRAQQFKLVAGDQIRWTNSAGGSGTVTADAWKLATVTGIVIRPGTASVITLTKTTASAFDFALTVPGTATVAAGQSVDSSLAATLTSGVSTAVGFAASGLPAGASATFSATSCTPQCTTTLTLSTTAATPVGNHPVTLTATGGGLTRSASLMLTVTAATVAPAPDPIVSPPPPPPPSTGTSSPTPTPPNTSGTQADGTAGGSWSWSASLLLLLILGALHRVQPVREGDKP